MIEIKYERLGETRVEAPGQTLLEVSNAQGVPHFQACGGNARCSTCRVMVLQGAENLGPRTAAEAALAERKGLPSEVRLACQTRVHGPVTIQRLVLDEMDAENAYTYDATTALSSGKAMKIAILFSDLRGFTTFSESSLPYDVMHILNRYLFGIGEAIHNNGGYIDKYMGDGVMALFGLQGGGPAKASSQAVSAGLDMRHSLEQFNVYLKEQFGTTFKMGIGIHVGEVVVGEMGHPERRQLTVLGDVVNTASRVESATKEFGTDLLITEAVLREVRESFKIGRTFEASLKGKASSHTLFEVLDGCDCPSFEETEERAAQIVLQGITRIDAPGLLRLAFHDALSGGVNGSIRHPEALAHPENRGLEVPLQKLASIKTRLPSLSWADLIALGGAAAVERCGGPHIPLPLGRKDDTVAFDPDGIPGRDIDVGIIKHAFAQQGFSARDLVALSGAHTLGKVDGTPFTCDPFSFSNSYYRHLLEASQHLLPSDHALLKDPETLAFVKEYATIEKAFFADFVAAYRRMVS